MKVQKPLLRRTGTNNIKFCHELTRTKITNASRTGSWLLWCFVIVHIESCSLSSPVLPICKTNYLFDNLSTIEMLCSVQNSSNAEINSGEYISKEILFPSLRRSFVIYFFSIFSIDSTRTERCENVKEKSCFENWIESLLIITVCVVIVK